MRVCAAALIALVLPTFALAGITFEHNLFVSGAFNGSNSDVEGRLAVGGSATLANYSIGTGLSNSSGTRDDLIVGGALSFTNGQVFYGNIRYAGSASLTGVGVPNGTAAVGSPLDFSALQTQYQNYSNQFAGLATTGSVVYQPWNAIELTGSDAVLNVFNILGSKLSSANSLNITAPAGSTVLINVDGTTVSFQNAGQSLSGVDGGHVLFNFNSASSLSMSGIGLYGSVLAPYAAFNFNNGQINGAGAVASYSGSGEWHNLGFTGTLGNPVIPAPAAGVLGALGLGVMSLFRRGR